MAEYGTLERIRSVWLLTCWKVKSPEVIKDRILPFSTFFYKSSHNPGTKRAKAPRKAHSTTLLTLFRQGIRRFDLWSTVGPLESKNSQNSCFYEKCFSEKVFLSTKKFTQKGTTLILSASCFSCQDASNELSFDLKTSCWKFDLKSRSWPDPKRSCCIVSWSVSSAWTHPWCFHRSSLSLSKVTAEKLLVIFHDLKWPWRRKELVAIIRFRVSSIPTTRCLRVVRMVFVQKSRLSIFAYRLIMERSQNWPHPGSPI